MQLAMTVTAMVLLPPAVVSAAAYFIDRGVRREEETAERER
jgi:hypothetical protein